MSTPGAGNADDDRRRQADTPTQAMDLGRPTGATSVGETSVGGAGTTDDAGAGDYVPGMYSDPPASTGTASTGKNAPAPVSASREAPSAFSRGPRTQQQTQVAPVAVTRSFGDPAPSRAGDASGTRTGTVIAGGPSMEDRRALHEREKEHFGGIRFGSAFFGWLTATGMFVLLSTLIGAIAALFGVGSDLSTADLTSGSGEVRTAGTVAAIVFGAALLISYYAGGYVAGRMARFSGAKQGIAVWLWAVVLALVLTLIGLVVGNQANVSDQFRNLNLPSVADLTVPGLISLLVVAALALLGAVLGGLAGMRYHRRIDRTDFDAVARPEAR